jgi:HTH-type transcriptional regulator/antitoxin HigA
MTMEIRPIRTEADHEAVLAEIWRLMEMEPEPGSPEGDRLEVLALLSEAYEAKHHPIEPADPIDAIKFMMEQKGLDRADLEPALGHSGRVSEVLNRRRPLSINMIRALVGLLDIPADILMRPYPLAASSTEESEEDAGAVVRALKRRVSGCVGAANSNDRMLAAAKRARASAVAPRKAAAKGATKAAARKATAARQSTAITGKPAQGAAAKRSPPSKSGIGSRPSKPTGSRRGNRPTGRSR